MTSVVIVAFDGLQPSQVTPELMPNLARFADRGVRFDRHHPVYPTVTRLNAASIVTGCYPATHGIAANRMVFRDVDPYRPLDVLEPQLRKVDAATGGRILLVPTLAERLAERGLEYFAVVSGTSGNAYCHNPNAASVGGATIHPDFCLPDALYGRLADRYGGWPGEEVPNIPRLRHATTLLLEHARAERGAAVSCIWYSEPDKTQHRFGVGSPEAVRALAAADEEFGKLLVGIERAGDERDTNVLVLSDHGYTTVISGVDIEGEVRAAGFPPATEPRGVTVATNGGSVIFYTRDGDQETAARLVGWLARQPWCGPILAADRVGPIEGALPASVANIDGVRGPDVAISFRWNSEKNEHGYPGHAYSTGVHSPGEGNHGSMSRFEMRNTLIARGPAFKQGALSSAPSGNVDIAPTVLRLLDIEDAGGMDGRVLKEALAGGPDPSSVKCVTRRYDASLPVAGGTYRQSVTVSEAEGVQYVDEGSAAVEAR